jgi:hypothetical protein
MREAAVLRAWSTPDHHVIKPLKCSKIKTPSMGITNVR